VSDELVYVQLGLGEQPVPYLRGWELQRQIHGQRVNDEIPDTCLLLQHEPVFMAGKRTSPLDRPPGDASRSARSPRSGSGCRAA
jgi:lipoate-protein ligase B